MLVQAGLCRACSETTTRYKQILKIASSSKSFYSLQGRFSIAAKHHVSIAEIYETEISDIEKAISSYEQAADYYKGEESNR